MTIFYLFLGFVVLYFIFAPRFAVWFYRPFLFPRVPMISHMETPSIQGIKGLAVEFRQQNGNKLCAWFFRLPEARQVMLVSHGNLGNIETQSYLTESLLKAGFSVFIYDYSGYGASTGLPDLTTVSGDVHAAYDHLVNEEGLQPEHIVFYGESIGAAIAAHLATSRPAKALICQSGFVSLRKIACEKMPILHLYPEALFPCRVLDTATNLSKVNLPLLIMHGQKDALVPFQHAEMLYKAANSPKQLISFADCGHNDIVFDREEYFVDSVQKFLQSIY